MNNTCQIINDINQRIKNGENPDVVIPWSLDCDNKDLMFELLCLIVKHSKIESRIESAKRRLEEW